MAFFYPSPLLPSKAGLKSGVFNPKTARDKETWDMHARQIVYEGCFYKFKQNKDAYDYLMNTKGQYLVEASPYDTVWGIGLGCNDERVSDPENWKGTNWLGQVLTALRDDFEGV